MEKCPLHQRMELPLTGKPSFARDKDKERMGAGADGLVGEWVGKWKKPF